MLGHQELTVFLFVGLVIQEEAERIGFDGGLEMGGRWQEPQLPAVEAMVPGKERRRRWLGR